MTLNMLHRFIFVREKNSYSMLATKEEARCIS